MARVLIISDSVLGGRARIEREAAVFVQAGWEVVVAGVPNAKPTPPTWRVVELDPRVYQTFNSRMLLTILLARHGARTCARAFWQLPCREAAYLQLQAVQPDLAIAHNHRALPFAARLKEALGIPAMLDLHEYPIGQYIERRVWRLVHAPYIRGYLDHYLRCMDLVTAVSSGIAEQVRLDHSLAQVPTTIRSFATYESAACREPDGILEVLYHGVISRHRGLEVVIDSVAEWREEFRLTVRGRGTPEYLGALKQRARAAGVAHRVRFEPEVPRNRVVAAASAHDIGIFVTQGASPQRRFVLPNKLFEYIMAGLAVCVSDLPEMAAVVLKHGVGVTVSEAAPRSVASTLNALTPERIAEFKRASLRAAQEVCWEREAERFVAAYASAGVAIKGCTVRAVNA